MQQRGAKDFTSPEAVKAIDRIVDTVMTQKMAENAVSLVQKSGTGKLSIERRNEIRAELNAQLAKLGLKDVSSNTAKAIDAIIDLSVLARDAGIIDAPGGVSSRQLTELFATLFVRENQAVRIDQSELTHVPIVVKNMMAFYEASFAAKNGKEPSISEKKLAFFTALFHDAGKFDKNIKTSDGFTVLKGNGFLNPSGQDIPVKAGRILPEAINRLTDPNTADGKAFLKQWLHWVRRPHRCRNEGDEGSPLYTFLDFLPGILLHQDSLAVAVAIRQLVDAKLIDETQGTRMLKPWLIMAWIALGSSPILSATWGYFPRRWKLR